MSTTIHDALLTTVREALSDAERLVRTLKQAERELQGDHFNASPPKANGHAPSGVMCKHNEPAVLKTLKSKKTGNPYDVYVCGREREQQCDLWQFPEK